MACKRCSEATSPEEAPEEAPEVAIEDTPEEASEETPPLCVCPLCHTGASPIATSGAPQVSPL